MNWLKRNYPTIVFLAIIVMLTSCSPYGRANFQSKTDRFLIGVGQFLNLLILGATGLAFAYAYAKRTKNSENMAVISAICSSIFIYFTSTNYLNYNDDLVDHPVVMVEFLISVLFIGVIVWQLVKGSKVDKATLNGNKKKKSSNPTEFLDDQVSDEDEII